MAIFTVFQNLPCHFIFSAVHKLSIYTKTCHKEKYEISYKNIPTDRALSRMVWIILTQTNPIHVILLPVAEKYRL